MSRLEMLPSLVREIKDQTRAAALRNFAFRLFGAVWVLVSTVLSTMSLEIVRTVAGQWRAVLTAL